MRAKGIFVTLFVTANLAGAAFALAQGNGNGNGKGNGGGGGGDEEPPAAFEPAIAYFDDGRKYKDIRLANRAGDQACLVLRSNQGQQELRGFSFDAANSQLAYSIDETGIYIASWSDNPCEITGSTEIHPLSAGNFPEFLDFSPSGQFLTWTAYDNPNIGDVRIWIYDASTGISRDLPLSGWVILGLRFSPEFPDSGELFFVGGDSSSPAGTQFSLFAYDVNAPVASGSNPRLVFDATPSGSSLDSFLAVTNPVGSEAPRVAVSQNGEIQQLDLSGQAVPDAEGIPGSEPVYSCDNTELVHNYQESWSRRETRITPANGGAYERWSRDELRWLDWICP